MNFGGLLFVTFYNQLHFQTAWNDYFPDSSPDVIRNDRVIDVQGNNFYISNCVFVDGDVQCIKIGTASKIVIETCYLNNLKGSSDGAISLGYADQVISKVYANKVNNDHNTYGYLNLSPYQQTLCKSVLINLCTYTQSIGKKIPNYLGNGKYDIKQFNCTDNYGGTAGLQFSGTTSEISKISFSSFNNNLCSYTEGSEERATTLYLANTGRNFQINNINIVNCSSINNANNFIFYVRATTELNSCSFIASPSNEYLVGAPSSGSSFTVTMNKCYVDSSLKTDNFNIDIQEPASEEFSNTMEDFNINDYFASPEPSPEPTPDATEAPERTAIESKTENNADEPERTVVQEAIDTGNTNKTVLKIGVSVSGVVLLLLAVALITFFVLKKKKENDESAETSEPDSVYLDENIIEDNNTKEVEQSIFLTTTTNDISDPFEVDFEEDTALFLG